MKKLVLVAIMGLVAATGFAQWQLADSSVNLPRYAVNFKSESKLFVGGTDTSSVSDDGGQTWNQFAHTLTNGSFNPLTYHLVRDAFFFDSLNGCAVLVDFVNRELIGKTSDGGFTWRAVLDSQYYGNFNRALSSICFPTPLVGYAAGYPSRIYKTIDGGEHWQLIQNSSSNYYFNDIYFSSADTGIAVGDYGVLRTTNGGLSWTTSGTNYRYNYTGVFIADTIAYICGLNSTLNIINMKAVSAAPNSISMGYSTGVINDYRDIYFTQPRYRVHYLRFDLPHFRRGQNI
jgi:photosystem II stability/assembly factor-like uncharacterized protein